VKQDSLEKDIPAIGFYGGHLTKIPLPAAIGKLALYLSDNSMEDFWLALTFPGNQKIEPWRPLN
jgi:hypothetical protein